MANRCQGPQLTGRRLCNKEIGSEAAPGFWCEVCKTVDYCGDCKQAEKLQAVCKDNDHQLYMYKKPEERTAWSIVRPYPDLHHLGLTRFFLGRANGTSEKLKNALKLLSDYEKGHYDKDARDAMRQLTSRLKDEMREKQADAGMEEISEATEGEGSYEVRVMWRREVNVQLAWREMKAAREVLERRGNERAVERLEEMMGEIEKDVGKWMTSGMDSLMGGV